MGSLSVEAAEESSAVGRFTAMRDGLITVIANASMFHRDQISACDFGISTFSGCSIVLQPGPGSNFQPLTYGTFAAAACKNRQQMENWSITGILLVKDMGNPKQLLGDLWQGADDLFDAIDVDSTLDGNACMARITEISRPSIDAFVTAGDQDFGFLTFEVEAQNW